MLKQIHSTPTIPPEHIGFSRLLQFGHLFQAELFPRLEAEIGAIDQRLALFIAACSMIPFGRLLAPYASTGRPPKSRLALAHAFLAKSIFNCPHTRQLIAELHTNEPLRRLCGYSCRSRIPHESSFSRAFAEFAQSELAQNAHEALIRATQEGRIIGHVARDSTAIEARERFPEPPAKPPEKPSRGSRKAFRRLAAAERLALTGTRLEKQLHSKDTAGQMLAEIPKTCTIGVKTNSKGHQSYWRGYKLHLDVADGQIPLTAVLTGASVHDSQVAIPMMKITSARVTYCYDLMDSAYDAASIRAMSARLFHVAIIDPKTPPKPKTQLPCRVKPIPVLDPPEVIRYRERTMVERVIGRLKDEFGGRFVRVRGAVKVMAHLMFGVLALTVDQLLRLSR